MAAGKGSPFFILSHELFHCIPCRGERGVWQWLAWATAEPHLAQVRSEKCCENWGWLNTPTPHKGIGCSGANLEHPAEAAGGLVIHTCVPWGHWCHPSLLQPLSPWSEHSQNGNRGWEGSESSEDSFPSSMHRILLETGLEFLRPEERNAFASSPPWAGWVPL